jgi:hypothetical protein
VSNLNTVCGVFNALQSPGLTSETIVLPAQHQADTTRANALIALPGDLAQGGTWDGQPFRLVVTGRVVSTASENVTVAAYLSNASTPNTNLTTFTSDIKVLNTSTMATGGATGLAFYISMLGMWNSTSATNGRFAFYPEAGGLKSISGTSAVFVATDVIGNSGTAITTTQAAATFYVTGLFGTGGAGSSLTVNYYIDRV